jgi:hypothetical protein
MAKDPAIGRKENPMQVTIVDHGIISQVNITTKKRGIRATAKAIEKLDSLGILHEEEKEWMEKIVRQTIELVEEEEKKNHQTKEGKK